MSDNTVDTQLSQQLKEINNALKNFNTTGTKEEKKFVPFKYNNSQHFVEEFVKQTGISISNDRFYFIDGSGKRIKNYYKLFLKFWDNEKDRRGVNKEDCLSFLAFLKEDKKEEVWDETVKKLTTYKDDGTAELCKLANMIIKNDRKVNKSEEDLYIEREIFKATFMVWVKNIKCKLLKINHRWPLIPVFWSYQGGTGKSALIEHLISPFKPFIHGATLEDISNSEKNYKMFTEKMVVYCEELANASKANVEAIKDSVTRKTIQPRRFHTQDHEDEDCFSTFIFTSNSPISKVINDPANRRFVDIEIAAEITEQELKSIDYLKLIQSIDIDRNDSDMLLTRIRVDTFVMPFLNSTKRKDFVEEFIEAACVQTNKNSLLNKDINVLHIYDNFKNYFKYQEINVVMRKDTFINELCNRLRVKEKRTEFFKRCISIDLAVYKKDASAEMRQYDTPRF